MRVAPLLLLMACDSRPRVDLAALRAEAPRNVDAIAVAERAYLEALGKVVPQPEPFPRPVEALGADKVTWRVGSGFDELGWAPPGNDPVLGTYSVVPSADGQDFVVNGWIDADGDGTPAHYVATRADNAALQTAPDVY